MKRFLSLIIIFVSCITMFGKGPVIVRIDSSTKYIYVVREYVTYYEDVKSDKTLDEIFTSVPFKKMNDSEVDFTNRNKSYTYWIRFSVKNEQSAGLYRLEMFDHNIDEVSLYYKDKDSIVAKHSGYSLRFKNRDLYHKNIGFLLEIPKGDTITYLMRFKSNSRNVLEPVIRSIPEFYHYSIVEYTLLGFFYGLSFIIVLYNIVCYLILKKTQYFFYFMYMSCMVLFLMSRNGTGFQFFWPDSPRINYLVEILSSAVGISFLLLFINFFLAQNKDTKKASSWLIGIIVLNLCSVPFQIWNETHMVHLVIAIVLIHVAFGIGFVMYRKSKHKSIFFMLSFVILDIGFVVSWLEQLSMIESSVFTVYGLYAAINLQFISISISMIQSVKQLGDEKSKAIEELLATVDKNQMMRILALKKQMSPHFIFNSLNSILQRIMSGNKDDASEYLVKLSKLIRKTLEQSDALYVTLTDELESLKIYLSLEAMRLGQTFQYSIEIDPKVNTDTALIPSFIIQPFVENSIWHGLMPKMGEKNLWVKIEKNGFDLTISIEDNGIGRAQSALHKKQHGSTSQGMNLIMERIELLNLKYQVDSSIEVLDLYDTENIATGTKVIIKTNFTNEQLFNSNHSR